jgi:feruloyl-CoA synthase
MRFVDAEDPAKGLVFDGRLAEDFKLSTGTWVGVGSLRVRLVAHGAGYLQDAVIAGHDRAFVSALLFPNLPLCRGLCPDLGPEASARKVLDDPRVVEVFRRALEALAAESSGSSTLVARAVLLDLPPSIDAHEVTDKGSLNQRAVLHSRAERVAELYAEPPPPHVIRLEKTS